MLTKGAAPGELAGKLRGDATLTGDACSLSRTEIPVHILARLAAEGVSTLAEWRALGRRRYEIWGITRKTVAQIDQLARTQPKTSLGRGLSRGPFTPDGGGRSR
jgi:hypothetical protein